MSRGGDSNTAHATSLTWPSASCHVLISVGTKPRHPGAFCSINISWGVRPSSRFGPHATVADHSKRAPHSVFIAPTRSSSRVRLTARIGANVHGHARFPNPRKPPAKRRPNSGPGCPALHSPRPATHEHSSPHVSTGLRPVRGSGNPEPAGHGRAQRDVGRSNSVRDDRFRHRCFFHTIDRPRPETMGSENWRVAPSHP